MGLKIIKLGLISIAYFVAIGIVCPFLISQPNTEFLWTGITALLVTFATIPSAFFYITKTFKVEKIDE